MTRNVYITACFFAGLVLLATACSQPPAVNPWVDDSLSRDAATTPSADAVLSSGHAPIVRDRGLTLMPAPNVTGDVPHYPLWWEDPFEDKGDGDQTYAWTWQDYAGMPYGLGRYILNTIAWPVSAVVTPPGTTLVSDGTVPPGRDHDAARGTAPDPLASHTDFGYEESLPPIGITATSPAP